MAIFCSHSIIRKLEVLGYISDKMVFVRCADDFVSLSVGLHACIPTGV